VATLARAVAKTGQRLYVHKITLIVIALRRHFPNYSEVTHQLRTPADRLIPPTIHRQSDPYKPL